MARRGFGKFAAAAAAGCLLPSRGKAESAAPDLTEVAAGNPGAAPAESLRVLAAKKGLLVGTAFSSGAFHKDPKYGEVMAREFNCLVAENEMKLNVIQKVRGEFDFAPAEAMMTFAAGNDMKVRAVPLVWHEALPAWAQDRTFPRQEALDILREHIFTTMRHFRGRVFAWDVVNEGRDNAGPGLREASPWFRSIGPDYIEQAYRWAHEADPEAMLFYNDFDMDGLGESADRCHAWIKELLAREVPIHGIGLQYHVKIDKHPDPAAVAKNIRRFNDLGLAVHITELDVWLPTQATAAHLRQQAEVYHGVFENALAARNCPAVMLWGFTDRYSWVPRTSGGTYDHALIFDRDYQPKPAYQAIVDALR